MLRNCFFFFFHQLNESGKLFLTSDKKVWIKAVGYLYKQITFTWADGSVQSWWIRVIYNNDCTELYQAISQAIFLSINNSDIGTLYADIQYNCTTVSEILFLYNSRLVIIY